MSNYPLAMSPTNQPAVNQLCDEAITFNQQISARDITPASDFSARVLAIFTLTGTTKLASYLDGTSS